MAHNEPRPFINATPVSRPDLASRRNARNYAKRGKNTGKRRKHLVKKLCLGSWINQQLTAGLCQDPEPLQQVLACKIQVPMQIGSEWTLFKFVEEIGPHMRQKTYKCKFR